MSSPTYNVLFLCTGNTSRSIIAEAVMNKVGGGRFIAFSAGSHPTGKVNPNAIKLLQSLNYNVDALRSKSWDEFAASGSPKMDFVFTVCDDAAGEICPIWPGQPISAHWGIPDPAAACGTDAEIALAFLEAYRMLNSRITIFTTLPFASIDGLSLQRKLNDLGKKTHAGPENVS